MSNEDRTGMLNISDATVLMDGKVLPVLLSSNADRVLCEISEARYVLAGPDDQGYTYMVEVPPFDGPKQ